MLILFYYINIIILNINNDILIFPHKRLKLIEKFYNNCEKE